MELKSQINWQKHNKLYNSTAFQDDIQEQAPPQRNRRRLKTITNNSQHTHSHNVKNIQQECERHNNGTLLLDFKLKVKPNEFRF